MAEKKKSGIQWHKVTPLSKGIAMAIFVIFPFVGFYLGMQYQKNLVPLNNVLYSMPTNWERIKTAFAACEVKGGMQAHSRMVSVTLKSGTTLTGKEPGIDDVFRLAREAEKKCGYRINLATE